MIGYGMQATAAVALYTAFALWSLAAILLVRRVKISPFFEPAIMVSQAILGPIVLAQLLICVFWLVPGVSPKICLFLAFGAPVVVIASLWRSLLEIVRDLSGAGSSMSTATRSWIQIGVVALLLPLILLAFPLAFLPLHGNDPLEYMQLGRMFAERRDASLYPLVTALPESGFIAPWTHPPTYAVLISFAFMLQGSTVVAGAAKLVGLWFAIMTAVLAACAVYASDRRLSWRVWLTPAVMLSMPVYFELIMSAHIDGMRIATFTMAIILTSHAIASRTMSGVVIVGISIAAAMLSHSIGVLAIAIALPLLIICWGGSLRHLAVAILVIFSIVFLCSGPHYIRNIFVFGNPIQDNLPVWDIENLRVKEFLQTSRGLETIYDRLYHGVFMPWTRIDIFGYLPFLILTLTPFAFIRSHQKHKFSFRSLLEARKNSVTFHLAVAVLGFMGLILLTVLAGTELAVKNARYILTILPCVIVVSMITIGTLIDDDRVTRIAHGVGRFILSITPQRFRPTKLKPREPLDQGSQKPTSGLFNRAAYLDFAVIGCAALVFGAQFLANAVTFKGNVSPYIGSFYGLHSKILESEIMKRNGSSLDDALVEHLAATSLPSGSQMLIFRQASYGFYSSPRFRYHGDAALVDLFKLKDARSLRTALLHHKLSWILVPNFSLPEINHSAFDLLFRDPALVRLVSKSNGWALYELRTDADRVVAQTVAQAMPAVTPDRKLYATTDTGPGMVDGQRAGLTLDMAAGTAELFRKRDTVKQLNRWDAMVNRPIRSGYNPDELDAADFQITTNNPVLIEAIVSGKGLAEVVVDYVSLVPTPLDDTQLFTLDDREDTKVVLSREIIWSGILDEKPRTVGGWLGPVVSRLSDGGDGARRGARLIFRLRDGDRLKLHGWTAKTVIDSDDEERLTSQRTLMEAGWSFTQSTLHLLRGVLLRTPQPIMDRKPHWPFPPVGIERPTTIPVTIMPPSFWLSAIGHSSEPTNSARHLLEQSLTGAELQISVDATVSGLGRAVPILRLFCSGPELGPGAGVLQTLLGVGAARNKQIRDLQLPPLQLWDSKAKRMVWRATLPCLPYRARLLFRLETQSLLTPEEFSNDPDMARGGYLDVHDMQLVLLGGGGSKAITVPMQVRLPQSLVTAP